MAPATEKTLLVGALSALAELDLDTDRNWDADLLGRFLGGIAFSLTPEERMQHWQPITSTYRKRAGYEGDSDRPIQNLSRTLDRLIEEMATVELAVRARNESRVAAERGARYLDFRVKGWSLRVDEAVLDAASYQNSVTGQLVFAEAMDFVTQVLFGFAIADCDGSNHDADCGDDCLHGLTNHSHETDDELVACYDRRYGLLTEAWRDAIAERRTAERRAA